MISCDIRRKDSSIPVEQRLEHNVTEHKAATTIQKIWRGLKVRERIVWPAFAALSEFDHALPVGNDPKSYLQRHVTLTKHPAIVTTGGVQCLFNAINLTAKEDGELGEKPKIFIMDYNPDIIRFWRLLQRAFEESESVESFLEKMPYYTGEFDSTTGRSSYTAPYPPEFTEEEKFSQWLIAGGYSRNSQEMCFETCFPELDVNNFHPVELYAFFHQLFESKQNRFNWIKSTVLNQTHLMHACWIRSPEYFTFIKSICDVHDYELFVYPSNIAECHKGWKKEIWDNISILQPRMTVNIKTLWREDGAGHPMSVEYI